MEHLEHEPKEDRCAILMSIKPTLRQEHGDKEDMSQQKKFSPPGKYENCNSVCSNDMTSKYQSICLKANVKIKYV